MDRHDEQLDPTLDAELAALDAELRRLMPVAAPGDLVRRIEVAAGVYDPALNADLRRELGVDVPAELVDQVVAACGLADVPLDRALRAALAAGAAPAGLADRIDAATTHRVRRRVEIEVPAIVGRIGLAAAWRGAVAAALLAAATVALVLTGIEPNAPTGPIATHDGTRTLDEQIALLSMTLDDAAAEPDALGAQIDAVASEIDDAAVAMTIGSIEDSFGTSTGLLDDELDLLEARIKNF